MGSTHGCVVCQCRFCLRIRLTHSHSKQRSLLIIIAQRQSLQACVRCMHVCMCVSMVRHDLCTCKTATNKSMHVVCNSCIKYHHLSNKKMFSGFTIRTPACVCQFEHSALSVKIRCLNSCVKRGRQRAARVNALSLTNLLTRVSTALFRV